LTQLLRGISGVDVLLVDVREVIVDSLLCQLDEARNALSFQDCPMELDELRAVLDQLYHLLDLLEAAPVPMLHVWNEELEQVLAHLVLDNGLAGHLLLLHREPVKNPEAQTERKSKAADLVELVALFFEEVDFPGRNLVLALGHYPRVVINKLGDLHKEGLVLDLNDAFELEDVFQQKVDQVHRRLILDLFVCLIYLAYPCLLRLSRLQVADGLLLVD